MTDKARYTIAVSISAPEFPVDIYSEVSTKVALKAAEVAAEIQSDIETAAIETSSIFD